MRFLIFTLALLSFSYAGTPDLKSYCAGWCRARYQSGTEIHGKCACIDYYPINLSRRIEVPKRQKKKFLEPKAYDGYDDMHFSTGD